MKKRGIAEFHLERKYTMFEKLTETLDSFITDYGIPFYDCSVMKDGECVYRRSNGYTDSERTKPVTRKELYNIYSCSKFITCVAALQLYEKGMIRLEDELCKYMPEFTDMTVKSDGAFVPARNKITVEQLFTMTAGFSYDLNSPQLMLCRAETGGECPTLETMKYLAKEPLLFEPGYRWEYSLCHDVLAALVEKVSGMSFGEYVKENIFDVCGMERSTFLPNEKTVEEIVTQYRYNAEKGKVEECAKTCAYRIGTKYESGGAGCVSTVDDYIKFLEGVRTYKLLKKETVDLLSTNHMTKQQMDMPSYWVKDKRGYGLGQQCPRQGDTKRPDFGWGGAAAAYYFIDRTRNVSAYFGTHVLGYEAFSQRRPCIVEIIQDIIN